MKAKLSLPNSVPMTIFLLSMVTPGLDVLYCVSDRIFSANLIITVEQHKRYIVNVSDVNVNSSFWAFIGCKNKQTEVLSEQNICQVQVDPSLLTEPKCLTVFLQLQSATHTFKREAGSDGLRTSVSV